MNEFVIAAAGALGAFLMKVVDWMFNKKSNQEDVKAKTIDNEIKLSETYKDMLDDLKPRYNDMLKEFEETVKAKEKIQLAKERLLKEEVALLRKENKMLKQQLIEKDNIIKGFKNGARS